MENFNWFGKFLYLIGVVNKKEKLRLWHPFLLVSIPFLIVVMGTIKVYKEVKNQGTWVL